MPLQSDRHACRWMPVLAVAWKSPLMNTSPCKVPRMNRDSIAVLIPALNESLRIREVVQGALAECRNVIVVDDGSDDDTVAQIQDLPITLLRHAERLGKGASLRDGFAEALRRGFAGVLTM